MRVEGEKFATVMRDDPGVSFEDKNSWQDWEIEHLVEKLCRDFPAKSRVAVEKAVNACKQTIQASAGRERLIDCARRELSH
jgi:hypothetical protein